MKITKIGNIWPFFLVAFLAWYSYILWLEESPKTEELSNSIEAKEVNVGSKVGGRIKEIFIEEGTYVKKGQKLLTLEGEEIQAQLEQAKANYNKSLHELNDLKSGSRTQEILQAEAYTKKIKANLEKAKIKAETANNDFTKIENLFSEGAVSEKEFDAYKNENLVSKKDVEHLEQEYLWAIENESIIKEGPRKDKIKAFESNSIQNGNKVKELNKYVSELNIYAPTDGEVSSFNLEIGEIVKPQETILTITDLKDMFVRVYIPNNKLSEIETMQKIMLMVDGFPNESFTGYVTYIGSKAEFTPRNIQTPEERSNLVYPIKIQIENKNNKLKNGMYVTIQI